VTVWYAGLGETGFRPNLHRGRSSKTGETKAEGGTKKKQKMVEVEVNEQIRARDFEMKR
jgi:hypothetical protein